MMDLNKSNTEIICENILKKINREVKISKLLNEIEDKAFIERLTNEWVELMKKSLEKYNK